MSAVCLNIQNSAICLQFKSQPFVYILNISFLFVFQMSAVCLHIKYQLFLYIFKIQLFVCNLKSAIYFHFQISAVCLHFNIDTKTPSNGNFKIYCNYFSL